MKRSRARLALLVAMLPLMILVFSCKNFGGSIQFGDGLEEPPVSVTEGSPLSTTESQPPECPTYALADPAVESTAAGSTIHLAFTPALCSDCTLSVQMGKSGEALGDVAFLLTEDRASASASSVALDPGATYELQVAIGATASCKEQLMAAAFSSELEPGTAPRTDLIVGCNGKKVPIMVNNQPVVPEHINSSDLILLRGSEVVAQCDDTPIMADKIPGAIVASEDATQWLGWQVDTPTGNGEVLASYWEQTFYKYINNEITQYEAFRLFSDDLKKFKEVKAKHYFALDGWLLSALEDLDGDGFKDFVAVTKTEDMPTTLYGVEFFPGKEQGLDVESSWEQFLPLAQKGVKSRAPLQLAVSRSGLIAVTYEEGSPLGRFFRTAVYDAKTKAQVGIMSVGNLPLKTTTLCGLAIAELPQGAALAICIPDEANPNIKARIFVNKITAVDPMINFQISEVRIQLTQKPLNLQMIDGEFYLLAQGRVAVYPEGQLSHAFPIDPYNAGARLFEFQKGEYPFQVLRQDYDGDGKMDTLIKLRKSSDPTIGDRFFKIFLDESLTPCRTLQYTSCEQPQIG